MATTDASAPAAPPAPPRPRRWYWLLLGSGLLVGALLGCEGWAAWQEHLAARALANDQRAEAKRHINLALQVRRSRMTTLVLAARISRLSGVYSEAEQYLLRCDPSDNGKELVELEWLLLRCQQGDVDELGAHLLKLAQQGHPQTPAILETLASVYIRQTRYLEALLCLDRWLDRDPDSIRALDWRGWLGHQLDHRDQGILDYQHLLQLQPGRADIRLRLAQLLAESARHAEAAPLLEQLLVELPDNPAVPVALAACRISQDRFKEARALLDGVLTDHPDHFDALYQRGKVELTDDPSHPIEAESWLHKALALKPHDREARWSLYRSLQAQPDREREAEEERIRWEREGEKQNRLTSLLRKDLGAHPSNVELACEAGELFLDQGEEQRGLFWLHRALAINPGHVPSHRALLAYYDRTGNAAKAQEERRQLAELGAPPSHNRQGQ
jgi:Flp pilus assembly protein TadD